MPTTGQPAVIFDGRFLQTAYFIDERLVPERPREQLQGLARLVEAPLGKPSLVHGVAADQMLAQGAGGPLAKTHGPLRIHPVTDGNDRVQVVVLECASNASLAFRSNHQEILTS